MPESLLSKKQTNRARFGAEIEKGESVTLYTAEPYWHDHKPCWMIISRNDKGEKIQHFICSGYEFDSPETERDHVLNLLKEVPNDNKPHSPILHTSNPSARTEAYRIISPQDTACIAGIGAQGDNERP
jgi:hypothetical protein